MIIKVIEAFNFVPKIEKVSFFNETFRSIEKNQ